MAYKNKEDERAYRREWMRRWREKNGESYRKREWERKATPEYRAKRSAQRRESYQRNLEARRSQSLEEHYKSKYGISRSGKDAMLAAQGGRCAICRRDEHCGKGWHVDHCHSTGKVRGILCRACNIALGLAQDRPDRLRAMAAYLECHSGELVKV